MTVPRVSTDHGAAFTRETIRHREHLFRVAALFVAGLLLFVAVRALLVPSDFGL